MPEPGKYIYWAISSIQGGFGALHPLLLTLYPAPFFDIYLTQSVAAHPAYFLKPLGLRKLCPHTQYKPHSEVLLVYHVNLV